MMADIDKTERRKAGFARRKLAFDHYGKTGSTAGLLSEFLAGYRGIPLAGYMPINTEIDPTPAMAEAAAHGPVGVPVIRAAATPLDFSQWAPDCAMLEGPFKAMIPAQVVLLVPQIVIVPLVAFDLQGGRLGYGGGFYDRSLQHLRARGPVLAIGFAFDAQQDEGLPLEETDQPLNMIITETRVIEVQENSNEVQGDVN